MSERLKEAKKLHAERSSPDDAIEFIERYGAWLIAQAERVEEMEAEIEELYEQLEEDREAEYRRGIERGREQGLQRAAQRGGNL